MVKHSLNLPNLLLIRFVQDKWTFACFAFNQQARFKGSWKRYLEASILQTPDASIGVDFVDTSHEKRAHVDTSLTPQSTSGFLFARHVNNYWTLKCPKSRSVNHNSVLSVLVVELSYLHCHKVFYNTMLPIPFSALTTKPHNRRRLPPKRQPSLNPKPYLHQNVQERSPQSHWAAGIAK